MVKYPNLKHLFGSYLHQDFLDEFPTAIDAVHAFATGEPPDVVQSSIIEINNILADEQFNLEPESMLLKLGSYYDPCADGLTSSEWLRQVRNILSSER